MSIYPDDRVLVVIMNNKKDWAIVQDEGWYRIPAKHAPDCVPQVDYLAFYFTAKFGSDKWAIHYYAPVMGHELVRRKDLFPAKANHPRAGEWYYQMMLGPLQHKLPPITSHKWRRITFIETTGDRFENALEMNDLFDKQSPLGRLYVTLKEEGYTVEQYWHLAENQAEYVVDLAVETTGGWLGIQFNEDASKTEKILHLNPEMDIETCLAQIKAQV